MTASQSWLRQEQRNKTAKTVPSSNDERPRDVIILLLVTYEMYFGAFLEGREATRREKRGLRVKIERFGVKNARELGPMNLESGFGPNHVIRLGRFLLRRPLGTQAAIDFGVRPPPPPQAQSLGGLGTCHANDKVKFAFGLGFKQQRDIHHGNAASLGGPGVELAFPGRADAGMQDVFEPPALRR